jgi:predicted oxidoreductase|tara:strand:- start:762 stop:941 length:180 start_codon:yes stop_codon:yes gene_type:complete
LNYGGLSIWHQLKNRPDFVKAYMALNQVKTIMDNTDVYGRYFTYNAFEIAFKTKEDAYK